jgi:NAD(P)-dependent dehydrogenase (short-subunit alcohol dehydrogenase family)
MSLQAKLDAFKADFEAGKPPYNMSPDMIEVMHRATRELIASGQAERALKVGDREEAAAVQAKHAASIPLGRMARPEEIAAAMLFLASEDSSFVAGSELLVDGGMCSV